METPADLRFAATHEWVRVEDDGTLTVGISHHAQLELGDLVFVETPQVDAEVEIEAGSGVAVVESVKAASDVHAPLDGRIIDANAALAEEPELVNTDPYGAGWLFRMSVEDTDEVERLMGAEDYEAMVGPEGPEEDQG